MASGRHCRETGPIYLAKFSFSLPFPTQVRFPAVAGLRPALRPLPHGRGSDWSLERLLHSALFGRTAPVVRDGRHILDGADFNTGGAHRANRRLAARTGAGHAHFHHAQSAFIGLVGRRHGRLLGGEGSALARPAEAQRPRARPGDRIAFLIADGHDGVVEGGLDMHDARVNDALLLLLEALLLACFDWCFCHTILCLTRRLLLVRNGAAARTLAGAGVGMRALPAYRQAAAVTPIAGCTPLRFALFSSSDFFLPVPFFPALLLLKSASMVCLLSPPSRGFFVQ